MRGKRTPAAKVEAILQAASLGKSSRSIARDLGQPHQTIVDIRAANSPFISAYAEFNDPGQKAAWGWLFEDTLLDLAERRAAKTLTTTDRRNLTISAGIATEKLQLAHSRPTSLIASVSEVRISLSDVAGKLLRIGQVATRHASESAIAKGQAEASE